MIICFADIIWKATVIEPIPIFKMQKMQDPSKWIQAIKDEFLPT